MIVRSRLLMCLVAGLGSLVVYLAAAQSSRISPQPSAQPVGPSAPIDAVPRIDRVPTIAPVNTARELVALTYRRVFSRHPAELAQELAANPLCASVGNFQQLDAFLALGPTDLDGDFMKALGSLQATLMCLSANGARTYDLFFATLLSQGLRLPDSERDLLYAAYFNAALLAFDQVQHTGRSLVQILFTAHSSAVRNTLRHYPVTRRGIFAFGPRSGQLVQLPGTHCGRRTCKSVLARLLDTFEEPSLLGLGRCPLVTLVATNFRCTLAVSCEELDQTRAALKKIISQRVVTLASRRADLDDFESIAMLTRWAGLTFGDDFSQAREGLCAGGLGPPVQPWAESPDLMSCLIAARDAAQGPNCESLGNPPVGLDVGGVGTGAWDRQCVGNALAQASGSGCSTYGTDGGIVEVCPPAENAAANSGAHSGDNAGNEPKGQSRNSEGDRAARGNALLSEAKVTLSPISKTYPKIVAKMVDQCGRYNACGPAAGRTAAVQKALQTAVNKGHYAKGTPTNPDAYAQVCANGCSREGHGAMYLSESLITAPAEKSGWQSQVLVHELLHIAYAELGFDEEAGPARSREGEVIAVDKLGSSFHRLIDEITQPGRGGRIYNPKLRDPVEPDAFGICSAAAERARQQFSCSVDRVDRSRGIGPRRLYPRGEDPRVTYPLDLPGSAPHCTALSGSVLPRPPTACGLMLCAGIGECRCNTSVVPENVDGDATFVSPLSIDCQPGQIPDPARGGCVDIGGE